MTTFIEASTDERIAALLGLMQSRLDPSPASRYDPVVGFGIAEVAPSAWHALAGMRSELDDAGTHLLAACMAFVRWVPRVARGRRPPHAPTASLRRPPRSSP
jgi:hypothetical protein